MPKISDPSEPFKLYIKIDLPSLYAVDDKMSVPRPGKKPPVAVLPSKFELLDWDPAPLRGEKPCEGLLGGKLEFYNEI